MLVRRFAIVCLITFIFGMSFAILVAEAGRSKSEWIGAGVRPCPLGTCLTTR